MLGPQLFLIYINDIGEKCLSLTRLFVDNTSLGYSSSSPDTLELVIEHDLNKLSTWSEKWLMSFNPDKTEIMICSNMEMNKQLKLFIDTTSHKHLGITLSHDAKWSEHVENIVKTIEQIVHGTEGHMAVYGPVRHQKNIIWIEACPSSKKYYMDRSF